MMQSAVALPQPQRELVLESVGGSLDSLCYQGARNASFWVVHKALASLEDNKLKDWAATINLGLSVEALERELKYVKVILEFTLGKAIHNLALEEILMVLHDHVYDADDVLDEMEYFRIHADLLHASQHAEGCAHNMDLNALPYINGEPPNLSFNRDNTFRRIEHIVKQMQLIRQEASNTITLLGYDWSTAPNIAQCRPITISESIERKLYGRDLMMKSIIHDITEGKHSGEFLTVIPIVGPGGIGKTTLAQHIYHSGEVQEHFDVRVWTCVSLNFNVNKLIEEIQTYIPKVDHESSNGTCSELIGQRLKNKRLFLVLDDIWDCSDDDEWKWLLVPFRKSQVQGNVIIVTTRFPAQAHVMDRKNDHSIYLQGIENDEFKELFLDIVFGHDDQSRKDHEFLLEIGFMIAGRLKGSPLAAKTVGKLLKTKLGLAHWTRVLECKEWEHSDGRNDIMPALKLSFDYLPSPLQQCFSYCVLFPQDYKFKRQELINFWIGLEVLNPSHGENKRVEDVGLSRLTELINYGFLENKEGNDGRTCYIIHDLLHELARKVSSLECLSIDSSQSQVSSLKVLPSIRHLSINIDDTSVKDRLTLKYCIEHFYTLVTRLKVEKLQTLMIFGKHHGCFVKAFGHLFREAKALRLVFLLGASYDMKDLLHNFYYLIHLRYLRIVSSQGYEAGFPNKISRFYHMKILDARHCVIIDDLLPRDMSNLVKLRHFLVRDDALHSSIVEVGKLKSLQELRRFVVKSEGQGFELGEIGHLIELSGTLCIENLENVQVKEEADKAKLMQKTRLHELILHWSIDQSTDDCMLEEQVLERLKPCNNLMKLSIEGHRGTACPQWLGMDLSVKKLESLCLHGVGWKTFPPIGVLLPVNVPHGEVILGNNSDKKFEKLRRLELCKLTMVEKWAVHAPCQLFPFLEVLIINDCPQLGELSFQHFACCQQGKDTDLNLFLRLSELRIENCPKLLSFPPIPWSKTPCSINIKGIGSSSLDGLVSEEGSLTIEGKKDTTDSMFWNVLAFHNLTKLTELRMVDCQPILLHNLQMLSSLRSLAVEVSSWSIEFRFVEADGHFKYQFPIESLDIKGLSASGKELTKLLTYFPRLSNLTLTDCWNVTWLDVAKIEKQKVVETPGPSPSSGNKLKSRRQWKHQQEERTREDLLLLPPQLQELEIHYGRALSLHFNPHDESKEDDLTRVGGGLYGLTSLRRLRIVNCPNLLSDYSSSSTCGFPFPNSLEDLEIQWGAVGTDTPVPLSNLTSLTSLDIEDCEDLRGEGLFSLLTKGQLTALSVTESPNFFIDFKPSKVHDEQEPSTLQDLHIDIAGFPVEPIGGLLFSSLTKLGFHEIVEVEPFTRELEALLFVSCLQEITFRFCHNLRYLPAQLKRLPYLKRLFISWCKSIQILSMDGLPSSLEELGITCCPKLQSLPKDCLPDSLQKLRISSCPAIRSLPEVDDLPSSLQELHVHESGSEELRRQCRMLIGTIPIVKS